VKSRDHEKANYFYNEKIFYPDDYNYDIMGFNTKYKLMATKSKLNVK